MSRAPSRTPIEQRIGEFGVSRAPFVIWVALVLLATGGLVAAMVPVGPEWLGVTGSIVVATAYAWALATRTGGRPFVFGLLTLGCALTAVLSDQEVLLTGAAVATAALAAVLGVMATMPAQGLLGTVRECVVALLVAGVGAMAAVGFEPAIDTVRFEYAALTLAILGVLVLVYRLGAGLHGLGRRGLIVVGIGAVVLAATLLYAELLRRYGSAGLVDQLLSYVRWSREHLGAFPRPIETVLGVPALAYGCHMRARRRQGWWVCAFGVAATSPTATALANPAVTVQEAVLSVVYGLVVGLVIGWVLIRIDLALTGNRGRRSRAAEQAAALRPEPPRSQPLL
ncbi:hypothetical protein [Nocardioides sp. SYSU DS0651]|uniref:hypothetical protein n=1 Tax=Nocardioides sp. SYSU DS0651 TaxID=3415955 RepID=UPI003F4B8BED